MLPILHTGDTACTLCLHILSKNAIAVQLLTFNTSFGYSWVSLYHYAVNLVWGQPRLYQDAYHAVVE